MNDRAYLAADPTGKLAGIAAIAASWPLIEDKARSYAGANGASSSEVLVIPIGFDPVRNEWRLEARVRAADLVTSPDQSPDRARSTSRVAVSLQGLCGGGPGLGISMFGGCLTGPLFADLCTPASPPPAALPPLPAPPAPGPGDPSATATPIPPPPPPAPACAGPSGLADGQGLPVPCGASGSHDPTGPVGGLSVT